MACLNPKKLWECRDGSGKMTNKESAGRHGTQMLAPCRKCYLCRSTARMDWATRLTHESYMHGQASFITPTYSDECYPGEMNWEHVLAFRKAIRDYYGIEQAYFVMEAGEMTRRWHSHGLAFGRDFSGLDESYSWSNGQRRNPELESLWGMGYVTSCPVTPQTCNYVAGYIDKKSPSLEEAQENPFEARGRPMATRAIGRSFCEAFIDDMKNTGYCVIQGKIRPIPEVYFKWYPDELAEWKAIRVERALEASAPENRKENRVKTRNKAINRKAKELLYSGRSM